jgi:hypothetical protein
MPSFGATLRSRRLTRALLRRIVGFVLAFAVIGGLGQAGVRYFYCEALGLSMSDPCAAGRAELRDGVGARGDSCPLTTVDRPSSDCCTVITVPAMPDGARLHEHTIQPASVVALVPARTYAGDEGTALVPRGFEQTAVRWRAPPRPPGELRAQLMVFLT